jgi:hypothetical protein
MLQHSLRSIKRKRERESVCVCGGWRGVKAVLNFNSESETEHPG